MRSLILFSALLISTSAAAIPVTWTLNNVQFDDGGTAFGTYTYDAATNTYTDVAITTTADSGIFSGTVYFDACNVSTCHPEVIDSRPVFEKLFGPGDIESLFRLTLEGPMTNAGGVLAVSVGEPAEVDFLLRNRTVISGSVSAVPIPAAVWLFGSGLVGLRWTRRKQTA